MVLLKLLELKVNVEFINNKAVASPLTAIIIKLKIRTTDFIY